ncbi:MAG TPA: hypothetical protein VGF06_15730 [Terriglobales bacterium]|jgi:hypothetical protein
MLLDANAITSQIGSIILAIGGLGTAAYGVVDVTKAFGGGVSNRGFDDIKKAVSRFFPNGEGSSALSLSSVLGTLRSNWLNGMALADQKSVAKALIKLNLNPGTSDAMAAVTGVRADILGRIAEKISTGETLTPQEADVYGRFDLLLTSVLDQGYQRGDQRYRNSAKLLAVPVAIVLAYVGMWATGQHGTTASLYALLAGLLATPLAPIAKDVASAVQQAAKVAQVWKR